MSLLSWLDSRNLVSSASSSQGRVGQPDLQEMCWERSNLFFFWGKNHCNRPVWFDFRWCFLFVCFLLFIISSIQLLSHVQLCDLPQHPKLSCPSPTPRACSYSCPLSRWCHPNISSSVVPFSSCLQSFPASGSFPMSHFFASDGQSIGVSASALVLPMSIRD